MTESTAVPLRDGDFALIGFDLKKDIEILLDKAQTRLYVMNRIPSGTRAKRIGLMHGVGIQFHEIQDPASLERRFGSMRETA